MKIKKSSIVPILILLPVALLVFVATSIGIPKTIRDFKSSHKYFSNKEDDFKQRKIIVDELKGVNKKGSFKEERFRRLVLVEGDEGEFVVKLKNLKTDYNKDDVFSPELESFDVLDRE